MANHITSKGVLQKKISTWKVIFLISILGLIGFVFAVKTWGGEDLSLDEFKSQWLEKLQNSSAHTETLSIDEIIKNKTDSQLLDLSLQIPHYHDFPAPEMRTLMKAMKNCIRLDQPKAPLLKAWYWQQFVCGHHALPKDFFTSKPYIHPSGDSYVHLAETQMPSALPDLENRESLKTIRETLRAGTAVQKSLSEDIESLDLLLRQETIIVGEKFAFVKTTSPEEKSYWVFQIDDWNHFFSSQIYNFASSQTDRCLEKIGSGCWTQNRSLQSQRTERLVFIASMLAGLIGLSSLLLTVQRIRAKRIEEENRKFTLQMLTHELRTPITSLVLLAENLRSQFDELPANSQKNVLHLLEEVQRLKRTADSSTSYLQNSPLTDRKTSLLDIPTLIRRLQSQHSFHFEEPVAQRNIQTDDESLEFCLSNLLRNAEIHGKTPVSLRTSIDGKNCVFEIQDHGSLKTLDLKTLCLPFQKSERSQGLGLGLSLVWETCKKNGWSFQVSAPPTRFSISIPLIRTENSS